MPTWSRSSSSSPAVELELAPRIGLALLGLTALVAAVIACLCVAWAGAPLRALAGMVALALSVVPALRLVGLSPDSVAACTWAADSRWYIRRPTGGAWREVRLLASSSIVGPLVLLIWRDHCGRTSHVLLDEHSTGPGGFRRLRGRLRLEAHCLDRSVDKC
jgi:hypothetical protein